MNPETLKILILDLLDGCISQADLQALEAELSSSESARELYIEYTEIHSNLELQIAAEPTATNVVPIERIIRRQKRRTLKIAALSAAAILLISLVVMQFFLVKEQKPSLTFRVAPDSEFSITHSSNSDSSPSDQIMDEGSRLQLSQGTVELTFQSGVKSIVMAPADLTLHDNDTLFMNKGTAWFQVPKGAEGFTVKTKEFQIVDLGTEFGVLAKADDNDEVHVFQGSVEVTPSGLPDQSSILTADEARSINTGGRLETISIQPSAFLTEMPNSLPYLYWSFDKKDGLQASGNHPALSDISTEARPKKSPPVLTSGKQGTALLLEGNNQHLLTNWEGITDGNPRSVAFWFKLPKGTDLTKRPAIIGWGTAFYTNPKWKVQITHESTDDPPAARVTYGKHWFQGTTRLDDNQWHHFVAIYSGKTTDFDLPDVKIFIDGQEEPLKYLNKYSIDEEHVSSYTKAKSLSDSYPMSIGKGVEMKNTSFRGMIDELYIYEGILTKSAIKKMMVTPSSK